jgi:phosphoribosylformylglycinamidine cyclo-ligase
VLHFVEGLRIIKDDLLPIPPLFNAIQRMSGTDWKEMYKVFNMGHRLEFYVPAERAAEIVAISRSFGIEAKVIGRVEAAPAKEVILTSPHGTFIYH